MKRPHLTTRRRWLQGAAAASVPMIVPGSVLPGSVFGAQQQAAPSERITLGFVGTGKFGLAHLPAFLEANDVRVLAVCDVDTTRRDPWQLPAV